MDKSLGSQNTERPPGNAGTVSMGAAETPRPAGTRPASGRFRVGDAILGRYRITGELGQGGMGVVYRCFDETAGVDVALKALPPELSHDTGEMDEVRENFRLVAGLVHQNIASAKTLEKDPVSGDVYLIMECVDGMNLRQWRKREAGDRRSEVEGVALEKVLPVLRQAAAALDFAHGQKIVHRDVKPANIMLRPDGLVKVLDFGLAAQIHTSLSRVSRVHYGTSGTGPYMAPEQWEGRRQDARTDQYALAATVYELLAGRCPFESHDPAVLRQSVLHAVSVPVLGLSKAQNAALLRGLAKEPAERFVTCGDFCEALGGRASARAAGGGDRRSEARGRKTALWLAGAVVVLCYGTYWSYTSNRSYVARLAGERATSEQASRRDAEAQKAAAELKTAEEEKVRKAEAEQEEKKKAEREETAHQEAEAQQKAAKRAADQIAAERAAAEKVAAETAARAGAESRRVVAEKAKALADEAGAPDRAKAAYETAVRSDGQATDAFGKNDFLSASNLWTGAAFTFLEARKLAQEVAAAKAVAPATNAPSPVVAQTDPPAPKPLAAPITPPKPAGPEEGKNYTLDLGGGAKLAFVYFAPGEFTMDSDLGESRKAQHVKFAKGFWLGSTEVTRGFYRAVRPAQVTDGENSSMPMTRIKWADAADFGDSLALKLDAVKHAASGFRFRLPKEAEWEYVCRAGTGKRFYFGENASDLDDYEWYGKNTKRVHAAGELKPNPWGLYDMLGNVQEWCSDRYDGGGAQGNDKKVQYVLRGGHFRSNSLQVGCGRLSYADGDTAEDAIGFRLLMEAK